MRERVAKLRQQSLETKPWLSIERALLITEYYRNTKNVSIPMQRAEAFRYLMENGTTLTS